MDIDNLNNPILFGDISRNEPLFTANDPFAIGYTLSTTQILSNDVDYLSSSISTINLNNIPQISTDVNILSDNIYFLSNSIVSVRLSVENLNEKSIQHVSCIEQIDGLKNISSLFNTQINALSTSDDNIEISVVRNNQYIKLLEDDICAVYAIINRRIDSSCIKPISEFNNASEEFKNKITKLSTDLQNTNISVSNLSIYSNNLNTKINNLNQNIAYISSDYDTQISRNFKDHEHITNRIDVLVRTANGNMQDIHQLTVDVGNISGKLNDTINDINKTKIDIDEKYKYITSIEDSHNTRITTNANDIYYISSDLSTNYGIISSNFDVVYSQITEYDNKIDGSYEKTDNLISDVKSISSILLDAIDENTEAIEDIERNVSEVVTERLNGIVDEVMLNIDNYGNNIVIGNFQAGAKSNVSDGKNSIALGHGVVAKNLGSIAMGVKALATTSGAYTWNGDVNEENPDLYTDHGVGTYNINPIGGLSGFYIAETNLCSELSGIKTELSNVVDYRIEDYQQQLDVIDTRVAELEKRVDNIYNKINIVNLLSTTNIKSLILELTKFFDN